MYCPNCGQKILDTKWEVEDKTAGTLSAEVDCPGCKKKLKCIDAINIEDSSEIEIIFK